MTPGFGKKPILLLKCPFMMKQTNEPLAFLNIQHKIGAQDTNKAIGAGFGSHLLKYIK